MSEQETEVRLPPVQESNGDVPHGPPTTLLDRLRQIRAEAAQDRTLELEVPGWHGLVAMRLGPITGVQQSQLLDRMARSKSRDKDFALNADYLVNACREIVVREAYGEPWRSIEPADPVGLGERLVELLGLEPPSPTARGVLLGLFGNAPSPEVAITIAGGEYVGWAGAVNEEDDERFVGESPGAGR